MMDKILIGLTIAVILYPIISGMLMVRDFKNIGNDYWQEYWERKDNDESTGLFEAVEEIGQND